MIEDLWYKNAVLYSLDVDTFMDFNGDGVGDFEGLANRLNYLHALGVDTIWLAPFQPSPNKDNGYDIQDYYGIDRRHGSSGNFVEFMHQAKKLGIRVIIDLVVNHTSDKHPWFQEARKSRDSRYRDWYVWSDTKPPKADEGMVFPGVQKSTWTYDEVAKAYYHHRFYEHQPDLNMDNPEVREEIRRIMGYWLELGIAGFRVDAVPFILESSQNAKAKLNFDYLHEMRRFLQWRTADAIMLGEANVLPKDSIKYFGKQGEGIHVMFNFYVNQRLFYALACADVKPLVEALEKTRVEAPGAQWAHFLRNHDELDIDRLDEDQKQKVFERFGPEKNMQLYDRGIRRRLSPMLGNRPQTELAYSVMFSLPGTPVIRYGDEIGMGDDLSLKERNSVRTPMQWSADDNSGFSSAEKLVHPVISKGPYAYEHVNVDMQRRTPDSLLNWMTSIIRLRKECPEIGWGEWQIVGVEQPGVLVMHYHYEGSSIIIMHNFNGVACEVGLKLQKKSEVKLVDMMKVEESMADKKGMHQISMDAYGYRWFRAGDLSHLLSRRTT
jgi:maltose alpha-D-glucosyltransferase/alpha-amylase